MTLSAVPQLPSEKKFGVLFIFVFFLIAGYGYLKGWEKLWISFWAGLSALIALVTLVAPKLLAPFNRAWFALGQLMGRIVSPIILGAIFFILLTPVAIVTRLFGRDELRLKRRAVKSYWLKRQNNISPDQSFRNQF
jgi:hypothetical protein